MKNLFRRFLIWLFRAEYKEYQNFVQQYKKAIDKANKDAEKFNELLKNFDVSIDIDRYSPSWAVISLQGEKQDYVRFIQLPDSEIRTISSFLRQFDRKDRIKIDADYPTRDFFKKAMRINRF